MNALPTFLLFVAGLTSLILASGWLVTLLTWMARYLKLSEYSVAFLLMAGATSIPELFVGINSALTNTPELSLGNVLGANLLNVTLVIGLIVLILPIPLGSKRIAHEAGFIFALTITPLIFLFDGILSRADGAMLIFIFIAYLYYLFVSSRLPDSAINDVRPTPAAFREFIKKLFLLFLGTAVLLAASRAVVFAGWSLATSFGAPPFLMGLLVISLGTTLPELTFGIRSALRGRSGMGFGSAIGSVVFNLLFILGLVALIQPIAIGGAKSAVFLNLIAVTAIALILYVTLRLTNSVPRWMGGALILAYAAVVMTTLRLSIPGIL